jgi:AraC-like DNA-binding protein
MFQLQTATTEGVSTRQKMQFWNDLTSDILPEHCATAADPKVFCGRVRRVDLGAIRMAEISASASVVCRTRSHIAHALEQPYVLRLLLSGELQGSQDGIEIIQRPGDFALYDSSRPYRLTLRGDTALLSIRIPESRLLQHIPCPESVTSLVVSGNSDAGMLTSGFLREFWSGAGRIILSNAAPRIADIALQLIASSYALLPLKRLERTSYVALHRLEIITYIEEHLRDPALTPTKVSNALRLSPGYAHRIFSDGKESIGRYILRRRLECCREALVDPLQSGRTITHIAFGFGFASSAHFSRVFRERYGMTPREFREADKQHRSASGTGQPSSVGKCCPEGSPGSVTQ